MVVPHSLTHQNNVGILALIVYFVFFLIGMYGLITFTKHISGGEGKDIELPEMCGDIELFCDLQVCCCCLL